MGNRKKKENASRRRTRHFRQSLYTVMVCRKHISLVQHKLCIYVVCTLFLTMSFTIPCRWRELNP